LPETQILWVGVRDLDPLEEELMKRSGGTFLSPAWARDAFDNALAALSQHVDEVYVHIDPDVLDISVGKGNFLSGPGGLRLQETLSFLARIGEAFRVTGMAFASYDPACDGDGRIGRAAFAMLDTVLESPSRR
jgi:arginase family enzyme